MVAASILVAMNDPSLAHDLHERLLGLGYRVAGFATSNQDIVARIEECDPDLILTDIQLNGEREGIKTGALIHSIFDKPVIYITGSIGQNTIQRAKSTGPFGYIFKPLDDRQIYAVVETALLRHRLEAELRQGRQWLNAVLDGINDGVIALDAHGRISFINPIAKHLTGWNEIEALNQSLEAVFMLMDETSQASLDVLGSLHALNYKAAGSRMEGLLLSKDGRATPVEAEITSIDDGNNLDSGMVLVFRDISKSREAFREIQRQSQRAEALVETAAFLNAQLEYTSVLEAICTICNQALNATATAVFLEGASQHDFQLKAARTQSADLQKYRGRLYGFPEKMLEPLLSESLPVKIVKDILGNPDLPYLDLIKKQNIHTVGIAGMYRQHDLIGVVISIFVGDPLDLPEDTPVLFKGLADQATTALTNASLFEQVRKGRESQRALTTRLVEIQETERRHIARELHDEIGQVLTGLQFMLESSKNQAGPVLLNKLCEAQVTVSGLIEQIREMSLNLRPSILDDLGLLPTLLWHFERYTKQTGIKVVFTHNEINDRLLPEVETAVYRIVQEALTNIARHARVTEASVQLVLQEETLGVAIVDHGAGFDQRVDIARVATAGLTGMRERANMLGGYLLVKSGKEEGTQILAMLPLQHKPVERRTRDRKPAAG
jgi:PAS domain S-box-containing protein